METKNKIAELNTALAHLSPQEVGCWTRLALYYIEKRGELKADGGELKALMQCPDTAFARVKGQVLSGRPWMFTACRGGKLTCKELDEWLKFPNAWQTKTL